MTKVKKGLGKYRKIIAVSVKRKDIHSPGSWMQKLESKEFERKNENIPLVVLSTVQMSELINVIWSMALNCILTARNAKLTPRADIIINYIKTSIIHSCESQAHQHCNRMPKI